MNEIYLTSEIFGDEIPKEASGIVAALNREIDRFIGENDLNPETDENDFDSASEFSDRLSKFYRQHGKTPAEAISDGFYIVKNTEIAQIVAATLERLGFDPDYQSILNSIDVGRDPTEEALPTEPETISSYALGFLAEYETAEEMREE